MTKTTPKQIVLLFIVLWVLIGAVFAVYIIAPMLDSGSVAETDIQYAEDELTLLESGAENADEYILRNAELNATLKENTAVYYDMMKNSEADKLLISLIESCGAVPTGLGIDNAAAVEDFGIIDGYSVSEAEDEKSSVKTTVYSGVYAMRAKYQINTDYSGLLKIIGKINDNPSLLIESVSYEQDTSDTIGDDGEIIRAEAGKALSIELSVLVFMFPGN